MITSHSLRVRLTREGKEFPLPPSSSGDLTNLSLLMFIEKLDLLLIAEICQQQLAIFFINQWEHKTLMQAKTSGVDVPFIDHGC